VPLPAVRELAARHALLLIVGVGAVVRFATLGTQGFWFDEQATIDVVVQDPADLLRAIPVTESTPPLYYLLAGGWERLFGSGEFGLRSLSALLGTATIPVVYAAGRALGSHRAGLIAAALTATNPLLIWYSQEARSYALLVFLSALSFFLFVRALQGTSARWVWGWALASALALNTHYFAAALIVPEAAWLLWRRRDSRADVALATGAVAAVGIALLPLAASQEGKVTFVGGIDLADRLFRVAEHFVVGLSVPWPILPELVGAAVAAGLVYALVYGGEAVQRAAALGGGIALAGAAIALVGDLVGADYLITRNLLGLWAPVGVALGVALGAHRAGWLGPATAVALCGVGLALAIWNAATPAAQRPDWGELAAKLGEPQEERVIVDQSGLGYLSYPLTLYLDDARLSPPDETLSASELVVIGARPVTDYSLGACWWGAICGGRGAGSPSPFEVPAGFELVDEGSTSRLDYRLYRASEPIPLRGSPESPTSQATAFVQAPP
jgi:mannosyltransferase